MKERDAWDTRWDKRRNEIIAELTPKLRVEHPHVSWDELNSLIEKQADLRLVYERFSQEP